MQSLDPEKWTEYLNANPDLAADPQFPGRPDTDTFRLVSRIVRTMDDIGNIYDDPIVAILDLIDADAESMVYMCQERTRTALAALAEAHHDVFGPAAMSAAWMDGFTVGALFGNEHPELVKYRFIKARWEEAEEGP